VVIELLKGIFIKNHLKKKLPGLPESFCIFYPLLYNYPPDHQPKPIIKRRVIKYNIVLLIVMLQSFSNGDKNRINFNTAND